MAPPTNATMRPVASITRAAPKVLLLAASLLLGPVPTTLTSKYILSFLAAMACSHWLLSDTFIAGSNDCSNAAVQFVTTCEAPKVQICISSQ